MAWSTPKTFVAGETLLSSDMNKYLKSNMERQAASVATQGATNYAVTAANTMAERKIGWASVDTTQATSSTSYTNLSTTGPTVTVATGAAAMVIFGAEVVVNNFTAWMSVELSGASSSAANDDRCLEFGHQASGGVDVSQAILYTDMTPGTNTFTCKYRSGTPGSGSAQFSYRHLVVIPY